MELDFRQILLLVHILLGISWVGGILFVGWGVYPAVKKLKIPDQRLFLITLMKRTHTLFASIGAGVIITGIFLGTVLGPINHWEDLLSLSYGKLFLTALLIGLATLSWGVFVSYKQTMTVLRDEGIWKYAETGSSIPLKKEMFNVAVITSVEVLGFIALIIIMVLL